MRKQNEAAWRNFNKVLNKGVSYNELTGKFNFHFFNKIDVGYFFKFIGYTEYKVIAENILFKGEEVNNVQLNEWAKKGPSEKWTKEIAVPCGL
jgi:hypothetical protein